MDELLAAIEQMKAECDKIWTLINEDGPKEDCLTALLRLKAQLDLTVEAALSIDEGDF